MMMINFVLVTTNLPGFFFWRDYAKLYILIAEKCHVSQFLFIMDEKLRGNDIIDSFSITCDLNQCS